MELLGIFFCDYFNTYKFKKTINFNTYKFKNNKLTRPGTIPNFVCVKIL